MITLTEYVQAERWVNTIDEDIIKEAEGYTLSYDHKNQKTMVRLFDKEEKMIGEGGFDNSEMAIAILEEYFELDESDQSWNDSYEWAKSDQKLDEGLEPIEKFIERNAAEYQVRIDYIDPDVEVDNSFGIKVVFHSNNNRDDLGDFVKEVGSEMLKTYGAMSYNFDGREWTIAL